jgi:hypothetical protein
MAQLLEQRVACARQAQVVEAEIGREENTYADNNSEWQCRRTEQIVR